MLFNRKEVYKYLLNKRKEEIEARDLELLENRDKKDISSLKSNPEQSQQSLEI
jgi:hypothetical protein